MSEQYYLKSKLNIHGLIDLDQMAALLTTLVSRIDQQDKVIADLQNNSNSYVNIEVFSDTLNELERSIKENNLRLDAVQLSATSRVMNKV